MDSPKRVLAILAVALTLFSTGRAADQAATIVGADLADGTGAALRRANVRFVNDRVVSVGDVKPQAGDIVVDGQGLVVSPGFIDIYNQSASGLATDPAAGTQVSQGITTVVLGPDGDSPWPVGDYLSERRSAPSAVNVASFVGYATVRRQVMKDDFKRAARADEIARMALLVDQGMREGAAGLSSRPEHEVGGDAETAELIDLAKVVARYRGVYMSHIRDEAETSVEALKEAIAIGEGAHVAVQISRLEPGAVGVGPKAADAIALIEAARARGVDVTADPYPDVRDRRRLTLPEAIRKMTSAPAARLRLEDRGRIQPGAIADLVLLNPKAIAARSTFTNPALLSAGVEKVFVAGELVWDRGAATVARPGRVLMPGHTPVDSDAGGYRIVPDWGRLPAGMQFGEVPGMTIDAAGRVFAFTRAEPPVIEFDPSGKVLKTWGEKMFVWPHGIRVDRYGFLWITDGRARNGIGQQVFKFTRDGQLVMTLGRKGVSGDGPDTFNSPTDVAVAPNGDIFVSDGHVNSRIVKFSKDGTFIKAWGKRGDGPGEFNVPHTIFFDARGRLLVGDRSNRRIQIFDQDGRFLDQWTQFGSPSGIFIAPDDTLYVVDYNDKMALFVGSAKDGSIRTRSGQVLAEGVAVDAQGAIYVGETVTGHLGSTITGHAVKKLVRK
ncbi:MAG TPA: amidohydrolase family protein [Vicinamibacterales bacterium]|nr:amidohydrolase family protein [Vicinamibacterales bacterium]